MKHNNIGRLLKMGAFIVCLFISGVIFAASDQANQQSVTDYHELDSIIIDNTDYKKDRKGPVHFPHRTHALDYGISCWDCHHEYEDKWNTWSPWGETQKCVECHDPMEKDGDIVKLQTAYHLNCKICHLERRIFKDEPMAVYRRCTTCHLKGDE